MLAFQIHHHDDDTNNTEASVIWYPPNLPKNQVTGFLNNHTFPLLSSSFSLKRQGGKNSWMQESSSSWLVQELVTRVQPWLYPYGMPRCLLWTAEKEGRGMCC